MPRRVGLLLVLLAACGGSEVSGSTGAAGSTGSTSAASTGAGGSASSGSSGAGGSTSACDGFLSAFGEGTYYSADGSGACGFSPPSGGGELLVAAMNAPQYDGSNVCGMCAHIKGPQGEVTVRIVDLCPECKHGDLDLSPDAFAHIAPLADGRVKISWTEVRCEVVGPLVYHFKDGSNPWWTAVQIRNHRHRIAKIEAKRDNAWSSIARVDYNYFVADKGLGPGPYTLRVTDVHGHVVEDSNVPGGLDNANAPSSTQLAACK